MRPNPFPVDLVTFSEEVLYGKRRFLCSVFFWWKHNNLANRTQKCIQNLPTHLRWSILKAFTR